MYEFRLQFHWILFLGVQLTIIQYSFRLWLMMVSLPTHICVTRPQWIKYKKTHQTVCKGMSVFTIHCINKSYVSMYIMQSNCTPPITSFPALSFFIRLRPPFHQAAICGALWERHRAPCRALRSSKALIDRWLVSNWSPWSPRLPSVDSPAQRSVAIRSERKQIATWSHRS